MTTRDLADRWVVLVILLAMLALALCFSRAAHAQTSVVDDLLARSQVAIGTTTLTSSPLTIVGLPAGQTGGILRTGAGGLIGTGAIAAGDLPSTLTHRNVNELITGAWTFQGAPLTVSGGTLSLTNGASNLLLFSDPGVALPTLGTRSLGTKLALYSTVSATNLDFASGIGPATYWWSVPNLAGRFAWFANDGDINTEPADQDLVVELTAGRDLLPGQMYSGRLGLPNRKWGELNAAALRVETLVAQDVIATIGGRVLVGPTNILMEPLPAVAVGTSTACFRYNNFEVNDTIYFEVAGVVEFMFVTVDVGACAVNGLAGRAYTLTRNLGGVGGGPAWEAGAAAFNTGQVGEGFIDLYALDSIRTKAALTATPQVGPTIVGNVRFASGGADWAPRWAVGNLSGLYGYTTTTYGSAFGDPNVTWVAVDATNGFRVMRAATTIGQWDTAGVITIGAAVANQTGKIIIDSDSLDMQYRNSAGVLTTPFSISNFGSNAIASFNADLYANAGVRTAAVSYGSGNLTVTTSNSGSNIILQPFTGGGTVQPGVDAATALGTSAKRWNNIHLLLPAQSGSVPPPGGPFPYVVTGDAADNTRLGYFCGISGPIFLTPYPPCGAGMTLQMNFHCGVFISLSCNP